jgi:hypothetical protein
LFTCSREGTMNRRIRRSYFALLVIACLMLVATGLVTAQSPVSDTDLNRRPSTDESGTQPPESQAANGPLPDDNLPSGNTAPQAATRAFSYYMVAGTAFHGKSSTTTYAYDLKGCLHTVSAADQLNADIHLPQGAVIKYFRIYYNDTNASAGLTSFLTSYTPGMASDDLVTANSVGSGGLGFSDSAEITETVDNATYVYNFIAWPSINDATVQICGMRIAYYAPLFGAVALPIVMNAAGGP